MNEHASRQTMPGTAAEPGRLGHSPPAPPPSTGWERVIDRFRTVWGAVIRGPLGFVTATAVVFVSLWLPDRAGHVLAGVFMLTNGLYCALNFWRCREAHCVITGAGWTALGMAALVFAATDVHRLGWLWVGYAAVFVLGYGVEYVWTRRHGTNALRRSS